MSHILINHLTRATPSYRDQFRAAHRVITYLKARGLRGNIATRYGLDYASAGFQALRGAFPNYNSQTLEEVGLVAVNDGGCHYDHFRDQVMFPIPDDTGSVIDSGGRVFEDDGPRYLDSPEAEIFQKRYVLFSLTQAAEAIAVTGTTYVAEGYPDVVSLAQHGVQSVVATLNTATTDQHVKRLLGLAKRVVLCFDGDDIGRRTAACALDVCLSHVTDVADVSFLLLPRGHDPDSYAHVKGGGAFNDLTLEASSLEGFFLASAIQGCQLEYTEDQAWLVATAAPCFQQINAPTMLCRILTAVTGSSKFSVGELIDLCGLGKNVLPIIDRQWFYGRIQPVGSGWTVDEPRKQL